MRTASPVARRLTTQAGSASTSARRTSTTPTTLEWCRLRRRNSGTMRAGSALCAADGYRIVEVRCDGVGNVSNTDRLSCVPSNLSESQLMSDANPGSADAVVIAGAGPAGLTAALELVRRGRPTVVLEATDAIGGISQTVERDGWRFDIGGHRFFTKVPRVEEWWHDILGDDDFLTRPRMSRIFYRGKLFDYPIKPMNALRGLGVIEAIRCVASYLWVRVRKPDTSNYEGWVASRFGWRLYRHFFKSYTEKVWGMPASEMPADWAAQRIKNLPLWSAVW